MGIFSIKPKPTVMTPYQSLQDFRRDLDALIGQTLAARVSRKELQIALENSAQGLAVSEALLGSVR